MKKLCFLLLLPMLSIGQKEAAEQKVHEGVSLHDQGRYEEAIQKYDEAIELDQNNYLAMAEKALTLHSKKDYQAAIGLSKEILKLHGKENIENVYVTYANSLDHLGQTDAALKVYSDGLKKYPNSNMLHYNKGIAYANAGQTDKAIESFENATKGNPNHASSFNALAILNQERNRIAAILSAARYLAIDNSSSRAKSNLDLMRQLMSQGVSKTGEKSISVQVDAAMLDNKSKENNFSGTDIILSLASAIDYDEKNAAKSECERFIEKFETICSSVSEMKKGNKGYYWEYLAPYFIEMHKKGHVKAFAYVAFLTSKNQDVIDFHKNNPEQIDQFYSWSENYKWN